MPVVTRKAPPASPLQRFRAWSEKMLIEAAQLDLARKYPGTTVAPIRRGPLHAVVRTVFVTGYRLTPAPLRRWLLRRLLIRREQRWSSA